MPDRAESLPQVQPLDEHNLELLRHVHPPTWTNPLPVGRYNLVVIGGGTAGLVTAAGAAGLGAKVALIERDLLGGDCLNVGCVPSKALLRCARARSDAVAAAGYGVRVTGPLTADFPEIMQRMRKLRSGMSPHDSALRFSQLGVDVYFGSAEFIGRDKVRVEGQDLHFARACIATGARAAQLDIEGLAPSGYLTNETLFSLTELPPRLAVLGSGPVGCEMAQAFSRFGSDVTLLERSERILRREDSDASAVVDAALRNDGIRILTTARLSRASLFGNEIRLRIEQPSGGQEVAVDKVLIGAGRALNVQGLNLEAAGVAFDATHGVYVDDYLRTTNKHIYAAGDICSALKFTHAADAMARIVIQNALFFGRARMSRLIIPWCTYTDPELAHVGLSAEEAAAQGISITTIQQDLQDIDRAILDGEERGFLKVHLKAGTDRIIGATLVARHAGDMIGELCVAMSSGLGLKAIARTIHPYPTQAEVFRKAADAYNRSRLTPGVQRILSAVLRWRR